MAEPGNPIFENCVFAFWQSRDLPDATIDQSSQLHNTLENHAGEISPNDDDGKINLEDVTHIISTTSDFPQYSEARRNMISIVKPAWITQSLLKNKQAQPRPYTPDPNLIFSDITISCADIPTGDKDAIIGAVLAMGGAESSSLTRLTTHICALTVDHPKCQQALEKGLKCKMVLPHWLTMNRFDDCLKLGKRIDERPYCLPDPEIFKMKPEDTLAIPDSDRLLGASSPHPDTLPISTVDLRHLDVFRNKKVMISKDLEINGRHLKVLEDLIVNGDGSITNSVHNADMFICHWREGRDYTFASRAGIDVGNLSWLYHLITHNEWTSPLRRLLHYPIPREGIPGFEKFRITLSNYGGEARTYLENLVNVSGAEFTKSMKQDNTHLITARKSSEKCDAAEDWNIDMVNHLWIEESYAKCEVQKLSNPRYNHFPPRTNLGEIIGQTQFDPAVLESRYFPRDPTPSPSDPKPLRRPVMHEKDRNQPSLKISEDDEEEEEKKERRPAKAKKTAATRPRSKSTTALVSTPAPNRRISAEKENDTPSSTRSAKDKARANIHGLSADIALYEKEKKRKGPIWGGERAANNIDKQKSLKRRSSSPANLASEGEEFSEEEDTRTPKRQRTSKPANTLPPIGIRLLVTSYQGWIGNTNKEDADRKKLRELGVHVVQDPSNCTHLAAPAIVRTKKFLAALASGPTIVRSEFIDACIKDGKVPDATAFVLKDTTNEKRFGLKLKDAVARAKANKRSILRHVPIYCTEDIPNKPETYKDIVQANGGTFTLFRGKAFAKKVKPEEDEGGNEPVYLLSGTKEKEKVMWPIFREEAKKGNMVPRIVSTDWILNTAITQQLESSDDYLLDDEC
ncbi:BRCT-containing protein [Lachnellula hyalina]|uniref:BRCT-containing protein n=1 Tax=Lachnellula hyalina TaxID=1316788 RepID=A0A8H8R4K5_9HELO|nr:BRCT-containing protein [Lachnellula hyalina]TVY27375.1 BRCT-containing protein [Lachnellula hyalina]